MTFNPPQFEMSESGKEFQRALAEQFARFYDAIEHLTSERDEARLLYCNQLSPIDPHKVAEKWKWNCFNSNEEKFWDALDRVRKTPSRSEAMDRLSQLDEECGL